MNGKKSDEDNRVDLFIDKYSELENTIRKVYSVKNENQSPVGFLENRSEYRDIADALACARQTRNVLSHYRRVRTSFPLLPSQEMVDFLIGVIDRVERRPLARGIAVPYAEMFCCGREDSVIGTINTMRERLFTHVPIVDNRRVIGIFDENSLFCYVADNGIVDLDDLKLSDLAEYTELSGREMEVFTFHKKDTFVDELEEEFQRQFNKGKRLGVAFLTENGRKEEGIIGMLTAWDILGVG